MEFTGRLYFDFVSEDVFRFHQLLAAAEREGATLGLEWRGFPSLDTASDRTALAASELVRLEHPELHGKFLQAALAAVHLEGDDPAGGEVVSIAAHVAGIPQPDVAAKRCETLGGAYLDKTIEEAIALGVHGVPTVYRYGPPLLIRTTEGVSSGSNLRRLELIEAVLTDDALWEVSKP